MPVPTREDLISRTAAAAQLGLPPKTFDRRVKALGLRAFRLWGDNRIFYVRDDINSIDIITPIPVERS